MVAAPGVLGNDTDVEGDSLTVSVVNGLAANVGSEITLASGAKVTLNANGSFTYKPNGAFESLDTGETATDSFTYRANDGDLNSDPATVTIIRRQRRAGRGRRHGHDQRGHQPRGRRPGRARQ